MEKYAFLAVFAFTLAVGLAMAVPPSTFAQSTDSDTIVILNTQLGSIAIEFFPDDAPNHVANFINLSKNGFYDGTLFHRIIPGFMIQGGDPLTKAGEITKSSWGTGGPDKQINAEFNSIKHERGIVSMARSADPNSASSQFFIVHDDSLYLDGQYTAFGRIITQESFDTLDKIVSLEATDTVPNDWEQAKIISVNVVDRSEITDALDLEDIARSINFVSAIGNQMYSSERLGIEFSAPIGWFVQEPPKNNPDIPDVVAVKESGVLFPTVIALTIRDANDRDLIEYMTEYKENFLQPSINSGNLIIVEEKQENSFGKDTYLIHATAETPTGANSTETVQFTDITFLENDKLYTFSYVSLLSTQADDLNLFYGLIESFKILGSDENANIPDDSPTPALDSDDAQDDTNGSDGGCLIATATYGSEMAPQVQFLREIRDDTVLQTESGATFMAGFNQFYYSFSPTIADWQRQNPIFKEVVKLAITPLLSSLAILDYVNINSESDMLGYGVAIITMNIGMYFVVPAIFIHRISRK